MHIWGLIWLLGKGLAAGGKRVGCLGGEVSVGAPTGASGGFNSGGWWLPFPTGMFAEGESGPRDPERVRSSLCPGIPKELHAGNVSPPSPGAPLPPVLGPFSPSPGPRMDQWMLLPPGNPAPQFPPRSSLGKQKCFSHLPAALLFLEATHAITGTWPQQLGRKALFFCKPNYPSSN